MNIGKARAIFDQIEEAICSEETKMDAIRQVIKMPTINSIHRDNLWKVLIWLCRRIPEWSLCEDELPLFSDEYLVSLDNNSVTVAEFDGEDWTKCDREVVAWRTLPKAYREVRDE